VIEDAEIGRALVRLRGSRSQQFLADRMRERGWRWSQATVWSVEKGDRPLRLAEAVDVAEVLGADSVADLVGAPLDADIAAAIAEHRGSIFTLMNAVAAFEQSRVNIVPHAVIAAQNGRVSEPALDAISSTPEEVIEVMRKDDAQREQPRMLGDASDLIASIRAQAARGEH